CRRRKLDALKNGAEIDLEALRGFVEMLPFERLLIEARVSGQVFGHGIHPCRVQYSKGFPPHIFERQAASNAIIGKQFENLATFRHVGIRGRPEIVNQLLRDRHEISVSSYATIRT